MVRAVLTHRLSPTGEIAPTVVVVYLVDGQGPFLAEGGPPPVAATPLLRTIHTTATAVRGVLRRE